MSWCFGKYSRSNPFVFSFVPVSTVDAARGSKILHPVLLLPNDVGQILYHGSGVIDRNICESSNLIMAFDCFGFLAGIFFTNSNDFCVSVSVSKQAPPALPSTVSASQCPKRLRFCAEMDGRSNGWISEFCHVFMMIFVCRVLPLWRSLRLALRSPISNNPE